MRIGPLGIWELLIILVLVLLIFGPRRLPEMAKGIGQSVREFRKGIRDMKEDFEAEVKDDDAKPTGPSAARDRSARPEPATASPSTTAPASPATSAPASAEAPAGDVTPEDEAQSKTA